MEPEHLHFGGGPGQTVVNPVVLLVVLIAGILILKLPRTKAIVPLLVVGLLVPIDQIIVLGGAHFPMLRILLLFGMVRLAWAKIGSNEKIFSGGITRLDKTIIVFELFTFFNAILLWQDSGMLVRQLGDLYTLFGLYFLMRYLIRDPSDADKAVRTLIYVAVVVAGIMSYEQLTGHNPYALLGGVHASFYGSLMVRGERLRALAGFGHSILAGTFGAILAPLFIGLWLKDRKNLKLALVGLAASTVIVLASASSTPILAYAGGILAICMWPMRNMMRPIRWGIVMLLVSLHILMKAPVWQLIARVDLVGGSSGDHRYQLVNQCILHFKDWWLFGVKDTGAWGWDMFDTANQYVSIADSTGLIPFLLFVATIVYGFKFVGKTWRASIGNKDMALYNWSLGAALFANAVAFFGISYWDQTQVVWYTFLAIIVAAYFSVPAEATATVPGQVEPAKVVMALRPAYASENSKPLESYGRMVTGRLSAKPIRK
ncbi:MAG TPA: hypothetical protein VK709_19240 [Candidatus Saccharimonadales bacterium]|nr:hypothetical protein [Candidatus Saccharimonadales bacterium]